MEADDHQDGEECKDAESYTVKDDHVAVSNLLLPLRDPAPARPNMVRRVRI